MFKSLQRIFTIHDFCIASEYPHRLESKYLSLWSVAVCSFQLKWEHLKKKRKLQRIIAGSCTQAVLQSQQDFKSVSIQTLQPDPQLRFPAPLQLPLGLPTPWGHTLLQRKHSVSVWWLLPTLAAQPEAQASGHLSGLLPGDATVPSHLFAPPSGCDNGVHTWNYSKPSLMWALDFSYRDISPGGMEVWHLRCSRLWSEQMNTQK